MGKIVDEQGDWVVVEERVINSIGEGDLTQSWPTDEYFVRDRAVNYKAGGGIQAMNLSDAIKIATCLQAYAVT